MLNGLSLFSGIGGLDVALSEWVRPVAYCEIDPYCQAVLLSRMADESLSNNPIWDDIKTLDGTIFAGAVDIIYGGFPCQDISIAGHGKGLEGERSGLFFEIVRLCREISPKWIFLENVPAITSRGGGEVVRQIASLGYDCRWCVISASSIGALHKRDRWFLLANSTSKGANGHSERETAPHTLPTHASFTICNTDRKSSEQANPEPKPDQTRRHTRRGFTRQHWPFESIDHWQETVCKMDKCSDGIPNQVDRLKSLGNSVVPEQAREAFQILSGIIQHVD